MVVSAGIVVFGLSLLVQVGLGFHARWVLGAVARDAAIHGAVHRAGAGRPDLGRDGGVTESGTDRAAGMARLAVEKSVAPMLASFTVDASVEPSVRGTDLISVRIDAFYRGPLGSWPVQGTATAPIEAFVAQPDR